MKSWHEAKTDVRKIKPDRAIAVSLLNMIEVRLKDLKLKDRSEFASLIVEAHYEIIKDALTALMALDGYKTLSHEAPISYMDEFFPEFSESEVLFADLLRKLRNRIAYEGFFIEPAFVERNAEKLDGLVSKLVKLLKARLECDGKSKFRAVVGPGTATASRKATESSGSK